MNNIKTSRIISMAAMIIIGVYLLASPVSALARAVKIIGFVLLAVGVIGEIWCVAQKDYGMGVIGFAVEILLGAVFIARPYTIVSLFPTFAGISIMVNGALNLMSAFDLKKLGSSRWSASAAMAVVTILLGVVILMNPFSTVAVLVRIIGVIVIYNGVSGLLIAMQM